MAIYFKNEEPYVGRVLYTTEHMWMDGMLEESAVVWDMEKHTTKHIQIGYYGCDGTNLAGGRATIDADEETITDILHTLKADACKAFARSVTEYKQSIHKGSNAVVVRGRKVPKGTRVKVFWIGEKATYRSRRYSWMTETETIAGCHDEDGNKLWIKAEYLQPTDVLKSPNAKERKKFIQNYIREQAKALRIDLNARRKTA